jgi:hypothetical protein
MTLHALRLLDEQHPFEYYNTNIHSIQSTLFRQNAISCRFTCLMIDSIGDTELGQHADLIRDMFFRSHRDSRLLLRAVVAELDKSPEFQHMYDQVRLKNIYPLFRSRGIFSPTICFAIFVRCIMRIGCSSSLDDAFKKEIANLGCQLTDDCFPALEELRDLSNHWSNPCMIMIQEELNVWMDYRNFHKKGKVFTNRQM